MARTIGNPGSWIMSGIGAVAGALGHAATEVGAGDHPAPAPQIKEIGIDDLREALRLGAADFAALRGDVMFLIVVYPIIGVCLAAIAFQRELLPLLFPIASGFTLVGPIAAIGLYEMSRRREAGKDVSWADALAVFRSDALAPILALGVLLIGIFFVWLATAELIYDLTLGPARPTSLSAFAADVFGTAAGWAMIVVGCAVGFVFAFVALSISLVSFPLLLDRHVGVPVAVVTSMEVVRRNLRTALTWGFIVAALLALGSIPLFLGLVFVLPILGHATWHLYRRAVA